MRLLESSEDIRDIFGSFDKQSLSRIHKSKAFNVGDIVRNRKNELWVVSRIVHRKFIFFKKHGTNVELRVEI